MRRQNDQNQKQKQNGSQFCYCPTCKTRFEHQRGLPCRNQECPKCGEKLVGENCK